MNKRGVVPPVAFVVIGIVVLTFLLLGFFIVAQNVDWRIDETLIDTESVSNKDVATKIVVLDYITGRIPAFLIEKTNEWSALIITVSMFLLLFITFGDIIATFGTFNQWVGWLAGFLMAVIAANLQFVISIITFFVGILSVFGGIAVVLGIGTAFVAFVFANFGIKSMAPWMMRRKAMHHAAKMDVSSSRGANEAVRGVRAMRAMGRDIARNG